MNQPDRWQLVERLYHAVLERHVSERSAFLDRACADDAALRDEVLSLLGYEDAAEGFIEGRAIEVAAELMAHDRVPSLLGRQIGAYQVLSLLGAGGMGEVYRARDTKLGRDVAIKVLSDAFLSHPERLARLEREARVLAALNDSHIGAIYGLEDSDGVRGLVLELVEGPTLAERLAAGPVPVHEVLNSARQIADALEAAHEKGIIHRDLKPANIKITPNGVVKVLDFGLAKTRIDDQVGSDLSRSPIETLQGTREGMIVGTAAYMSPEQMRGQAADKRTDIWAFGCVLYELLTGRPTFARDTLSDTIAGVLEREPDWNALPATTPPAVRRLLHRCLEKDVRRRLRDIADARIDLDEVPTANASPRTRTRRTLRWALSLTVTVIVGAILFSFRRSPSPPTPQFAGSALARFVITLPRSDVLPRLDYPAVALSSDGTHLAYIASRDGGSTRLYVRAIDSLETRPIPGTEGAVNPFFSPDGEWVGFFAERSLKKAPIRGGVPIVLCGTFPYPSGASWGSNGKIVLGSMGNGTGLFQVSETGGVPEALTALIASNHESEHRWPEVLPGGNAVVFTVPAPGGLWDDPQIVVQSLPTGARRILAQGTHGRYVPFGHLLFVRSGTLMALPFDLARLEGSGPPVPMLESVMQSATSGAAQFSVSRLGGLVYVPPMPSKLQGFDRLLMWVDRTGKSEPLPAPARLYNSPRLSPDGQRVVVGIDGANQQVWTYDLRRETLTRLTFDGANGTAIWTPDGKRVTFSSSRTGALNLFWTAADGTGSDEQLTAREESERPHSWTPDGAALAYVVAPPGKADGEVWMLSLNSGQRTTRRVPGASSAPAFSPNGQWLSYVSADSGRQEVYVQRFPGPGGKWQISTEGGIQPMWSRNGRELFYRNADRMMAVDVTTKPTFVAGKPKLLFEGKFERPAIRADYDVAPDGRRFLMVKANEQPPVTEFDIVLNWFEELRRRAPASRR